MSKYIRTKDGRILEWEKLNEITKLSIDTCEEPIKEADTIEELLDCLVSTERSVYNGDYHKHIMYPPFVIEEDGMFSTTIDTKGAIWTDKGLIYVAKMNDKRELELL